MKKKLLLLFTIILACLTVAIAEDVRFVASAKKVVAVGENFRISFSVNANARNFQTPSFKGFDVLSGPNQSTSTSVQFINGKTTQSVNYSYTYILRAKKEGKFRISPATIVVDGKKYRSNSLVIEVVKGKTQSTNQQNYQQQTGNTKQTQPVSSRDLFVKTIVSKTNPFRGEGVVVTQKLYSKFDIGDVGDFKPPSYTGFWTEEIKIDGWSKNIEKYHNERYYTIVLKRDIIFPQKTGEIKIKPTELKCLIFRVKTRKPRGSFERMMYGSKIQYQDREIHNLKSNPVKINVHQLPVKGKPADFSGIVGNIKFSSTISKTELKANEAINLKIIIQGRGNLRLIKEPQIDFPPDFEVYDAKIIDNISISGSGVSGKRVYDYLIIPRTPGNYEIKPINFSYFDLAKKSYITRSSQAYTINVLKSDGSRSEMTITSVSQEDIKYIGSDIHYIVSRPFALKKAGSYFTFSTLYYTLLLLPVVLFVLFIFIWRNQIKRRSNMVLMRNKKATKVARRRLKKAHEYLKQGKKEEFFIEISKTLWGYLSDKFTIPMAGLSMESVNEALKKKDVSGDLISEYIETLNNCEFARFAPGDSASTMEKIYTEGLGIISKIESELK